MDPAQSKTTYKPNSNLSDPQFGYDLVVATTQKSINTMMMEFLDRTHFKEVIGCFVKGEHKGDPWKAISYEELKTKANNTDPFAVPDTATDDDESIKNLKAARFKGAFKATIGLPSTTPLPHIVTLGKDISAPVTLNLLCSKFQITGFDSDGDWNNKSQPDSGDPWYFSTQVKLHSTSIDPKSPNLPAAVTQEVTKRLKAGTFSLQQMFLNLDTAVDFSTLTFKGLDKESSLAYLINATFCQAYIDEMKKTGHPVLGYSFIDDQPDASSFQLGAITMESCPFLDPSHNPYDNPTPDQQNAATFNYLCTTTKTAPTANHFKWNWVNVEDVKAAKFDGIMALRSDLFLNVLESAITKVMQDHFCYTANLGFTSYEDGGVRWDPSFGTGGKAKVVRHPLQAPVNPRQFNPFLQIDYSSPNDAHSPWKDWTDVTPWRVYVAYNCFFSASVDLAVQDDGLVIRLNIHSKLQAEYGHNEVSYLTYYHHLPQNNYVDYAATIDLPLRILEQGQITLDTRAKPYGVQSNNASYATYNGGTFGLGDYTIKWIDKHFKCRILDPQKKSIIDCVDHLAKEVADALQGATGWIFPGGKYFTFQDVNCSEFLDLIAYIKYADVKSS